MNLTRSAYLKQAYERHAQLFEYGDLLEGTNLQSIELRREGVFFRFTDPPVGMYALPGDTRNPALETLSFGEYEAPESRLLRRLFRGGCFFDIGANAGYHSLAIAAEHPESTIVAIEPIPLVAKCLRRNIRANGLNNILVEECGLAERSGRVSFRWDPQCTVATYQATSAFVEGELIEAELRTLDEMVERLGMMPDLIKCDVEGAELAVFRGGAQCLARKLPMILSESLRKWSARFDYHPNDLLEFLRGFGYQVFAVGEDCVTPCALVTERTEETNFLFLHPLRHAAALRTLETTVAA